MCGYPIPARFDHYLEAVGQGKARTANDRTRLSHETAKNLPLGLNEIPLIRTLDPGTAAA